MPVGRTSREPPARRLRRAAGTVAGGGLVAVLAVAAAHGRVEVVGPSMRPTLAEGDRLVFRRGRRGLAPGRLVVLADQRVPGGLAVKRVVATGPDGVAVVGDDASHSTDSRTWGPLARRAVRGVVLARYHPPGRAGPVG